MRGRRLTAALAVFGLLLPSVTDAAPKRKTSRPAVARGVPAGPAILPDVPLPAPRGASPTTKRATDLAELVKKRTGYDYDGHQMKLLARYDTPPDKRYAYAIDHDFSTIDAPRVRRYVERVADRLMACWGGPRPPIRILVEGSSAPRAYANDGGLIRLSAGLLDHVQTTDELSFVVAHELAHILYEHQAKREALQRAIEKGVGILASATILARETQFKTTGNKFDVSLRPHFGSTGYLLSGYSMQRFSEQAVIPFRKADQEFEADRMAYDLVACARFDPDGAKTAVLLLGDAERPDLTALRSAAQLGAAYIASVLVKPKNKDDLKATILKFGAQFFIGKGMDAAIDGIAAELEKSMGGEKRGKKLEDYVDKTYQPGGDVLPVADMGYGSLKTDPYWTSLYRVVAAVSEVDSSLVKAQIAAGAGKPYLYKPQMFQPWAAIGQPDPRVPQSFEIAAMSAPGPPARLVYERGSKLQWGYRRMLARAGDLQFSMGDGGALRQTRSLARERLGNVPELLPMDVQLAVLDNDTATAEVTAAQCLTRGGDALYGRCVEAMGYDPVCAPRTEVGKTAVAQAVAQRNAARFLNLPGVAASIGAPPPELLRCLANSGVTAAELSAN